MIELDRYQRDALHALSGAYRTGKRLIYLEAVVRTGKTYISSSLIKEIGELPVMIVVPNKTGSAFGPVLETIGIRSTFLNSTRPQIIKGANLCTYALLTHENWFDRLVRHPFGLIVFDEAHHVPDTTAEIWARTRVNFFPDQKILFMSGTPVKSDGTDSRKMAEFTHTIGADAATLSGRHGRLMKRLEEVKTWKEWDRRWSPDGGRSAIVFASNSQEAKTIYNETRHKRRALVLSNTSVKERERILNAFRNKELDVLITVRVLTEGGSLKPTDIVITGKSERANVPVAQAHGRAAGQSFTTTWYVAGVLGSDKSVVAKVDSGLFGNAGANVYQHKSKEKKRKKKKGFWERLIAG